MARVITSTDDLIDQPTEDTKEPGTSPGFIPPGQPDQPPADGDEDDEHELRAILDEVNAAKDTDTQIETME